MTGSPAISKESGMDIPDPMEQELDTKKMSSGKHHKRREKNKSDAKAQCETEKDTDIENQLLRLRADFENFRKRTIREKDEIYRRASESIILELLPVLDNLALGLKAAADHGADEAFIQGYKMVAEQLTNTLQNFGLKAIEATGKELDPGLHDAIANISSEEYPKGIVISETQKGYCLGEKLLRAAQVVVSSGPPTPKPQESTRDQ